jgi:HD-GYP domain-containing protein (c-di-GMP phosphodiesterase class II)
MARDASGARVSLAEIVAVLSLATDLGFGQPMEHVLRSCALALRLGESLGLDESERAVVYWVGLLACVGCLADAHEQARWFGDDIALKADVYAVDFAGLPMMAFMMGRVGAGEPPLARARRRVAFMAGGHKEAEGHYATDCLVAGTLAERLGLGAEVRDALQQAHERWDGRGGPNGLKGEEVAISVRLTRLARAAEVFYRRGGADAAIDVARKRRGSEFEPRLVDVFCERASELLDEVAATASWDAVVSAEPGLRTPLGEEELDAVLEALADYTDLKCPYTIGHSRCVADLAAEAGRRYGLPAEDVIVLRRAALVHDLGRLGISNSIWDKRGPWSAVEWERVRLHPYLTERMLASSRALQPLAVIAAQHHERLDGSGYPSGLSGSALSPAARILAAADLYQDATQEHPHRPARTPQDAAGELRAEIRAGRLDGSAADAVLATVGHRVGRRREAPSGLTSREIEVLRLLSRGLSNRQIAERLVITRKTASSHVEHIYAKAGVSSRAAASLFAVQHGLLPEERADDPGRAEHAALA